ncbi:MAG: hypothetical protein ACRDRI_16665 [Pseudonocardiaceae bacterium]
MVGGADAQEVLAEFNARYARALGGERYTTPRTPSADRGRHPAGVEVGGDGTVWINQPVG